MIRSAIAGICLCFCLGLAWPMFTRPDYSEQIITNVMRREGGLNLHDNGTVSNYGITVETLKTFGPRVGMRCSDCRVTVIRMTEAQARTVYRELWRYFRGAEIRDPRVADIAFDFFVNSGWLGIAGVQMTLRGLGYDVAVDARMGNETIRAINSADGEKLKKALSKYRADYYRYLSGYPPQAKYYSGWMERLQTF